MRSTVKLSRDAPLSASEFIIKGPTGSVHTTIYSVKYVIQKAKGLSIDHQRLLQATVLKLEPSLKVYSRRDRMIACYLWILFLLEKQSSPSPASIVPAQRWGCNSKVDDGGTLSA